MSGKARWRRQPGDTGPAAPVEVPVWTWRDAVRKADLEPLTKLVLYSLANYMTDVGTGCFPAVKTLMTDTGLSNRSVATHIAKAVEAGMLAVERRTGGDGRFQRTHYLPRFPDNAVLPRTPATVAQDLETDDEHPSEAASRGDLDDADHVNEAHAVKPREGASPGPRELGAHHRVNLAHAELSKEEIYSPLNPPVPGGDKANLAQVTSRPGAPPEQISAELAAKTTIPADVREHLLVPLLGEKRIITDLRDLATLEELGRRAAGLTVAELAGAAKRLLARRDKKIRPEHVRNEIEAARKHGAMITITARTPQWHRWREHLLAAGKRLDVELMDRSGKWTVPSEWPPGRSPPPPSPPPPTLATATGERP